MNYINFLLVLLFFFGCATKQKNYRTYVYHTSYAKKGTEKIYSVNGIIYIPKVSVPIGWTQRGIASWYGKNFHGKYTSNGEKYNMYSFTAAHKTLPMNTLVKVTNLNNNKSVIVRINDRGPFVKGRIIDLSYAAGMKIGLDKTGIAPVIIRVVSSNNKKVSISKYKIQIGAFLRRKPANKLAKKYQKLGYNTIVLQKGIFYKVFIVGFNTYKEARHFQLKHKISGFIRGE